MADYLIPLKENRPKKDSLDIPFDSLELQDIEKVIERLDIDRTVGKVKTFQGGTFEAKKRIQAFLNFKLDHFQDLRNDPTPF